MLFRHYQIKIALVYLLTFRIFDVFKANPLFLLIFKKEFIMRVESVISSSNQIFICLFSYFLLFRFSLFLSLYHFFPLHFSFNFFFSFIKKLHKYFTLTTITTSQKRTLNPKYKKCPELGNFENEVTHSST